MISLLFSLVGGAGLYFVPKMLLRALAQQTVASDRGTAFFYAICAGVALLACFYLAASSNIWIALITAVALFIVGRLRQPKRLTAGPLLSDALSPGLAAELSALESHVRAGGDPEDLHPIRAPDENAL